ncbi:MAG: hypothetical protein HQ546_02805 [Planctomycetes bacterium]|nr:hypothetical protein [Planctomycetota bacterium]
MNKLYQFLAMVCLVVTLSIAGLCLYLAAKGRLTSENQAVLVKLLRGERLVDTPTQPTEQPTAPKAILAAVADQPAENAQEPDLWERLLERRQAELRYRNDQLEILAKLVQRERDDLRRQRKQWAEEIELTKKVAADSGFQKQVKLYEALAPKQVKDILMNQPEAEAAGYLAAMSKQVAADVISKFRTAEEQQRLQNLLRLVRQTG